MGLGPQLAFQGVKAQSSIGIALESPLGTTTDAAGNVYIADSGHARVEWISPAGNQFTFDTGSLKLKQPTDVAIDGGGNLYIADAGLEAVYEVTPLAVAIPVVSSQSPSGLALDGAGNLYIADAVANTVVKVPPGPHSAIATVASGLNHPEGIAVDPAGTVVADQGSGNVFKIAPGGSLVAVAANLNKPSGLALDAAGDLYVTEFGGGSLRPDSTGRQHLHPRYLVHLAIRGRPGCGRRPVCHRLRGRSCIQDRTQRRAHVELCHHRWRQDQLRQSEGRESAEIGNGTLDFSAVAFPADFPEGSNDSDCDPPPSCRRSTPAP